ncbi:hypothetical protein BDR03DRAFT_958643 [Suillus americanus]|nr:hypothetical protein BDR03DRAFT_958643 [Suillus americanus]
MTLNAGLGLRSTSFNQIYVPTNIQCHIIGCYIVLNTRHSNISPSTIFFCSSQLEAKSIHIHPRLIDYELYSIVRESHMLLPSCSLPDTLNPLMNVNTSGLSDHPSTRLHKACCIPLKSPLWRTKDGDSNLGDTIHEELNEIIKWRKVHIRPARGLSVTSVWGTNCRKTAAVIQGHAENLCRTCDQLVLAQKLIGPRCQRRRTE